ncbi:MAG TPA: hypothetical protein VET88_09700 [Gammaproteobacteria bacterium]|nr:hypothetical protein [Gammaproteobacteria bacterium]
MSSASIGHTTHLIARSRRARLQHALRRFGVLLAGLRQPQAGEQPDWAHVPNRVWRRHSMLLVSLHELHGGMDHD